MAVYNLGSINADHVYQVPHLPSPGETLAASDFTTGLGGKGANQSVAAAQAGARVFHIGAIGVDGEWAVQRIKGYGVDTQFIATVETPTGHAIINVDRNAENAIVLFSGANRTQSADMITQALAGAGSGDTLLLQNETSHQATAAKLAQKKGMRVIYSAAPFDVDAVRAILPHVSVLALNEVEAAQLSVGLETELSDLGVAAILVTQGAKGAEWHADGTVIQAPAFEIDPVDTTGAGDTFAGYMAAAIDQDMAIQDALRLAAAAAALKVTRAGAADAIPARAQVEEFLKTRG